MGALTAEFGLQNVSAQFQAAAVIATCCSVFAYCKILVRRFRFVLLQEVRIPGRLVPPSPRRMRPHALQSVL